jgi:hemerythrin-like domain-containing protein
MPTRKTVKAVDAISLLKGDHEKVKGLFDKFEKATNLAAKKKIVSEAVMELKIHATVEEDLFYPALRQKMNDEDGLMDEADEEHHIAKVLIAELDKMKGDEEHWEAKFTVLSESIRHHIKEEEGEMFPEAKKTRIDFAVLGDRMNTLKKKLAQEGVPPDAEAKMVGKSGLRGDSPAKNAAKKIQVPLKG